MGNIVLGVKVLPGAKQELTLDIRAPENVGTYQGKCGFYMFDGKNAFVSFGKLITIILKVKNNETEEFKMITLASQLSEVENWVHLMIAMLHWLQTMGMLTRQGRLF